MSGLALAFAAICALPGPGELAELLGRERPVTGFEEVLFVKRRTYVSDHFYTDFINGCSPLHFRPDNGIYAVNVNTRAVRPVVTSADLPGGRGVIGRFALSFDAQTIVFDYKPSLAEGFRVWEVDVDGSDPRQLTFAPEDDRARIARYALDDPEEAARRYPRDLDWDGEPAPPCTGYNHHTDDMHPCYAPDGGVLFTSTRPEYITLCDYDGSLTTPVLHRILPDRSGIEQLTRSPVSEFSPAPMPDGRILYTRWEYIDKGSVCVKGLWSMNPDGTGSREVFGNNHANPATIAYGRAVPGVPDLVVAVGCPHYPQGGSLGTIMLLDTNKDIRTEAPVTYLTPEVRMVQEAGWRFGKRNERNGDAGPLYTDPFPIDEDLFLATCKRDPGQVWTTPAGYDLYFLRRSGALWRIYDDPELSCWQPTPLMAQPTPDVVLPGRDAQRAQAGEAVVVVTNVYEGMEGVAPGTVKWIRVNEAVPRFWSAQREQYGEPLWAPFITSTGWHGALWVRVQWGVAPVEEDGSAHFVVPADRNIFFQALDKDFMEVQRERTYVNYRPGEVRSCIGCHERSGRAAPMSQAKAPLALQRPPSVPGPQPGEKTGRRVIDYEHDVQPIFDAKCVTCHGRKDPSGGLTLTRDHRVFGAGSEYYVSSYLALIEGYRNGKQPKQYLGPLIGEDWQEMRWAEYLPPYSLGSHRSALVKKLRTDPAHAKRLTREEFVRLVTWIDSNAQYYGSYYGRHHRAHKRHPDFRRLATFEEAIRPEAPAWHH